MSTLVFDRARRRYRYSTTGTAVPHIRVWATIDRAITPSRQAMARLTQAYLAGGLTVEEWRSGMQRQIRLVHVGAVVVACGGLAALTPAQERYAAAVVAAQYGRLARIERALAAPDAPDRAVALAWAATLADSARGTYENTRVALEGRAGATEERRLRHQADACPTCLAEEARGWQALGAGLLIADGECATACRCRKETR